jgi:hypothetical protein
MVAAKYSSIGRVRRSNERDQITAAPATVGQSSSDIRASERAGTPVNVQTISASTACPSPIDATTITASQRR